MRQLGITIAIVLATSLAVPVQAQVTLPDGRVRVDIAPEAGPDGLRVRVHGDVGATGFDSTVEATPQHLRVEDVPMYGALQLDRDGFHRSYEELYGPPVANATIGTGGITEGVDRAGRLTNLSWPGPGHYDHVAYLNKTRRWQNRGAPLNAGSFGGVGGTWLTPAFGWETVSQSYAGPDTQTLVTVLRRGEDVVTITDVVDPTNDLVARNFRFSAESDGLAYYANMNPSTSRVPRLPSVPDAAADDLSDFGTIYDETTDALLHFRPYRVDPAAASLVATSQPTPENRDAAVRGSFGPGVYVAVGGQGAPAAWQAGLEAGGLVRSEAEGTPLIDPYYDYAQDASLSGAVAAFGDTAGGLAGLPPDPDGSYTLYLTAAESPAGALSLLTDAREDGFAAIRASSEAWWRGWLARTRLPASDDEHAVDVSRRALMLIRTAQDRRTGAIVANATTQTPYRQDWVRDGAFFNYALLLAGHADMVLEHNAFYRRVYRPGGTWDSFYYTDGAEAGAVFPYEIDSQALAVWGLWLPVAFGDAPAGYVEETYPAIRETADAIMLCTDPTNRMQCYAPEDDAFQPTQGAQGASTVYLALRSAADAADAMGDTASRDRYDARADELRAAALDRLCDENGCRGGRGGIYLVWPSKLLDPQSELAQAHFTKYVNLLDRRSGLAMSPGEFFQYPMESLLALAPFWDDPDGQTRLQDWVSWLAHDVAAPGVLHYGERIFFCDGQDPCEAGQTYLHSVGFPHIWSGAEMYIATAFTYGLSGCPSGVTGIGEAACHTGQNEVGLLRSGR